MIYGKDSQKKSTGGHAGGAEKQETCKAITSKTDGSIRLDGA
jgi:hypothetical protein